MDSNQKILEAILLLIIDYQIYTQEAYSNVYDYMKPEKYWVFIAHNRFCVSDQIINISGFIATPRTH